ncbi:MAG: phosphonate transport system ATP-binding protein [Verrucomicrobiales bacterium]|jgi:phosphonate transport system ATP-binding protein
MTVPLSGPDVAFELEAAGCRYGDLDALVPTSLRIASGDRVGLVGPSGSGKTTLLKLLNATVSPSSGNVSALGKRIDSLSQRDLRAVRSRIATIPQHLGLVPNLRVWQNVAMGRIGRRGFGGTLKDLLFLSKGTLAEIHELLDRVGIEEKLFARTSQLSGGQRQRVAVARALFQKPQAILADEPVSSVDPARAASLVALLNDLAKEHGLTLVISLHNLELAREHLPRLIGLRSGRVQLDQDSTLIEDAAFDELYHLSGSEMLEDGGAQG